MYSMYDDYDGGMFSNRLMYMCAMCKTLITSISNKTEFRTRLSLAFQSQLKAWKKLSKNPSAFEGRIAISSPCRFMLIKDHQGSDVVVLQSQSV